MDLFFNVREGKLSEFGYELPYKLNKERNKTISYIIADPLSFFPDIYISKKLKDTVRKMNRDIFQIDAIAAYSPYFEPDKGLLGELLEEFKYRRNSNEVNNFENNKRNYFIAVPLQRAKHE